VTTSSVQLPTPAGDQSNRYSEPPVPEFQVVTYIAYVELSLRHVMDWMGLPLGTAKPPTSRHE